MDYGNKYVNSLINFIKEHKHNFKEILPKNPFNLKRITNCPWHKNWYMFNYNIFSSDLKSDVVRACRGIVLSIDENEVKPVFVPYTKFFNYGQDEGKDIEELINWEKAKISIKIDGMLLKTACLEEDSEKRLYFFTNGSFNLNPPFYSEINAYDEVDTRGMQTYEIYYLIL
jgi:tRNA splicing ligase